MFSENELEILKTALEGDILYQEKQLEEIDDIRFEMWLCDTKILHKKVSKILFDIKSNKTQ